MNLVEDIATFLAAKGLTGIYKLQMPDKPDAATIIYATGGFKVSHELPAVDETVQIVCRAMLPRDAQVQAWTVFNFLYPANDDGKAIDLTPTTRVAVDALQTPFYFRRDEEGRHYFACNYRIRRWR